MTSVFTCHRARNLAAVSVASIAIMAVPAYAQPAVAGPEAEAQPGLADDNAIVVTGITKQAENVQDVPTTITAFSGERLEAQGIVDVSSVAAFTPGFNIRGGGNNPTALNLSIRGQVQNDTLATLEPSVGVYLDEVYVARAYGLNADLVDMANVQVLKGPQGTLFGRNTSAGAVLLQTNDPQMGEFSGTVKAGYARFDEKNLSGILNVPLGDRVAIRGAVNWTKRDNYQEDVRRPVEFGAREQLTARLKASVDLTENLNFLVSGDYFDSDIKGPGRQNRLFFLGGTDVAAADRALFDGDEDKVAITPLTPQAPSSRIFGVTDLFNEIETKTVNAKLTLDTFFGQVKLIGGYRQVEGLNLIDLDGSSFPGHFTSGYQNLKQYSGEFQVTGQAFQELVDFAAGFTYLRETGLDESRSATNGAFNWSGFAGTIDNDSVGMYAQTSIHATEQLSINVGGRYSIDDKGVTTQSALFPGNGQTPSVCFPTSFMGALAAAGTLTADDCNRGRSDTFKNFSYTVGADYEVTPDILVFAKQSRGYRSGAQQLRSLTLFDTAPAEPEVVNEQEVGLKTQFFDRRVTFNISGYHNKVKGAQRSVILNVGGTSQTVLENADTETYGVEADLNVRVAEGLNVFASGSVLDADYTDYTGFNAVGGLLVPVDKTNTRLVGVVRNQFTVGANYVRDIGFGELSLNGSYAWQDKQNQDPNIEANFIANGIPVALADDYVDATTSRAIGITNVRAALKFGRDQNIEVAAFGRNIFNERSPIYTLYLGGLNYVSSAYNEPATYGGSIQFTF